MVLLIATNYVLRVLLDLSVVVHRDGVTKVIKARVLLGGCTGIPCCLGVTRWLLSHHIWLL